MTHYCCHHCSNAVTLRSPHIFWFSECQWVHGWILFQPFAPYVLSSQPPLYQTSPLLQQSVTEYWQESWTSNAISPTSAFDVGQHNKIWGITFRPACMLISIVKEIQRGGNGTASPAASHFLFGEWRSHVPLHPLVSMVLLSNGKVLWKILTWGVFG